MRVKQGLNLSIVTISVIVFAIIFNYIVGMLGEKMPLKLDLTENKIFEISPKAKEYLDKVERPLKMYMLGEKDAISRNIVQILDMFTIESDNLSLEYVDVDKNPSFTQKFGDMEYYNFGSLIVSNEDSSRHKTISNSEMTTYNPISQRNDLLVLEDKVIAAIDYVQNPNRGGFHFVEGHNEQTSNDLTSVLEKENFTVGQVNLQTAIDENAKLFTIIAPSRDFAPNEIDALDAELSKGKSALFVLPPGTSNLSNLYKYLQEEWGIMVKNDIVFETDPSYLLEMQPYSILPVVQNTDVTRSIFERKLSIPYSTTSTIRSEAKSGIKLTSLLKTSENAISKNLENEQIVQQLQQGDEVGSFDVALLAENSENNGKILIIGSGHFMLDVYYLNHPNAGNMDLLKSCANYLLGSDATSISISPKDLSRPTININDGQRQIYTLVFWALLPLSCLIIGLVVWFRRRTL